MSIDFQPRALSDIEMAVDTLNQWRSTTGKRFIDRLNDTLSRLEQFPLLASKHEPTTSNFPELRIWLIRKDFGYLVCYVPTGDGISVIRVLHGSRNFAAIFGDD
jgi:plasmid stabilization system protein ParE